MPKHKKWIDKKHSKTYRLLPQNQNAGSCDDKHVQQAAGKKDIEEHDRCGIYFDDDYDYLQHLRKVNEVTGNGVERSIIRVPSEKTNLLTNIFEANGYEIDAELLKKEALPGEMHIDPYVIAELAEDDIEFENPTNDLDDDFVLQASGGELPMLQPPVSLSLRKNEFREKAIPGDDDSDDVMTGDDEEMELASDYGDDEMSEEDAFIPMKNKEELRSIDEKFNKLCEEYSETDDGETNEEDEEKFLLDPNSDGMKMLAEDFKKKTVELVLQKDALAHRYAEINDETVESDEEVEKIRIVCPQTKKAKWDCETVVSAYSNIFNRPALIDDSLRKQKLKSVLKQLEKMDYSVQSATKSAVSKVSSATIRKRGETAEERKTRKAAIKMIQADRRVEKKCNKLTFKEERKKAAAQCRGSVIKMMPIV
uniref:Protein LTV1 homolog n=1 Tax=Elaeophora elaphi TaxID=1147741 RepID=A0A0R3RU59_9BILA